MYTNVEMVKNFITNGLVTSNPRQQNGQTVQNITPLINIGNQFNSNNITNSVIFNHIKYASNFFDSQINTLYVTPLQQLVQFETFLFSDITSNTLISNPDATNGFDVGDVILLSDGIQPDTKVLVTAVVGNSTTESNISNNQVTFTPVAGGSVAFSAGSRVMKISFPPPVPEIVTQLAAATIMQRYFNNLQDTKVADYAVYMRKKARASIDSILTGKTTLWGAHRIGRRFYNGNLDQDYKTYQNSTPDNNIDDIQ